MNTSELPLKSQIQVCSSLSSATSRRLEGYCGAPVNHVGILPTKTHDVESACSETGGFPVRNSGNHTWGGGNDA